MTESTGVRQPKKLWLTCVWCKKAYTGARVTGRFCSVKCRKASWRADRKPFE